MKRPVFLLMLLLGCGQGVAAVLTPVTMPVTIKGSILVPVCTVTDTADASTVAVDFGSVDITAVGSAAAEQALPLKVACEGPAPTGKVLKMYVKPTSNGALTAAGANVLNTSRSGLGIALTTGGTDVDLNTWIPVTGINAGDSSPSGTLTLTARLVTPSAGTLTAGAFTAAANLVMEYQ